MSPPPRPRGRGPHRGGGGPRPFSTSTGDAAIKLRAGGPVSPARWWCGSGESSREIAEQWPASRQVPPFCLGGGDSVCRHGSTQRRGASSGFGGPVLLLASWEALSAVLLYVTWAWHLW